MLYVTLKGKLRRRLGIELVEPDSGLGQRSGDWNGEFQFHGHRVHFRVNDRHISAIAVEARSDPSRPEYDHFTTAWYYSASSLIRALERIASRSENITRQQQDGTVQQLQQRDGNSTLTPDEARLIEREAGDFFSRERQRRQRRLGTELTPEIQGLQFRMGPELTNEIDRGSNQPYASVLPHQFVYRTIRVRRYTPTGQCATRWCVLRHVTFRNVRYEELLLKEFTSVEDANAEVVSGRSVGRVWFRVSTMPADLVAEVSAEVPPVRRRPANVVRGGEEV